MEEKVGQCVEELKTGEVLEDGDQVGGLVDNDEYGEEFPFSFGDEVGESLAGQKS